MKMTAVYRLGQDFEPMAAHIFVPAKTLDEIKDSLELIQQMCALDYYDNHSEKMIERPATFAEFWKNCKEAEEGTFPDPMELLMVLEGHASVLWAPKPEFGAQPV